MNPKLDEALRSALETHDEVRYALVFGSSATGRPHAHSDVDVAVSLTHAVSASEIGHLANDLQSALGEGAPRIDLLVLDDAGPGVRYRVFRQGRLLLCRDEQAYRTGQVRAALEYADWLPYERRFTCAALEAARGG